MERITTAVVGGKDPNHAVAVKTYRAYLSGSAHGTLVSIPHYTPAIQTAFITGCNSKNANQAHESACHAALAIFFSFLQGVYREDVSGRPGAESCEANLASVSLEEPIN